MDLILSCDCQRMKGQARDVLPDILTMLSFWAKDPVNYPVLTTDKQCTIMISNWSKESQSQTNLLAAFRWKKAYIHHSSSMCLFPFCQDCCRTYWITSLRFPLSIGCGPMNPRLIITLDENDTTRGFSRSYSSRWWRLQAKWGKEDVHAFMQFTISLRSTGLLYLGTVRPRGSSNRYLRSTSMPNSKTLAEVYVAFPLFLCTEFLYQRHISLMSCRFKHPKDKA